MSFSLIYIKVMLLGALRFVTHIFLMKFAFYQYDFISLNALSAIFSGNKIGTYQFLIVVRYIFSLFRFKTVIEI